MSWVIPHSMRCSVEVPCGTGKPAARLILDWDGEANSPGQHSVWAGPVTGTSRSLQPAGRPDDLAGDPARLIRGQEDDGRGDVIRGADAAQRRVRRHPHSRLPLEQTLRGRALGLGVAGGNRVDPDLP